MRDVSRWHLVWIFTMVTLTGANVLRDGVSAWLWAALVAIASAGAVLAWRVRLQSVLPVPPVDELYASAAMLGVVVLAFGGIVLFQIISPDLFRIVAHGIFLCWFVVLIADRVDQREKFRGAART